MLRAFDQFSVQFFLTFFQFINCIVYLWSYRFVEFENYCILILIKLKTIAPYVIENTYPKWLAGPWVVVAQAGNNLFVRPDQGNRV